MNLTPLQKRMITTMRRQAIRPVYIAKQLDIPLKDVLLYMGEKPRGRPKLTEAERVGRNVLRLALKRRGVVGRRKYVRAAISAFGPELGLTMADVERVIEFGY